MTISGSAVVKRALALCPSPSQTPSTYGGSGSAASGSCSGAALVTEWFARRSAVAQRTVAAISAVVRTAGRPVRLRRDARVCVDHWCSASATTRVPSEKTTS